MFVYVREIIYTVLITIKRIFFIREGLYFSKILIYEKNIFTEHFVRIINNIYVG